MARRGGGRRTYVRDANGRFASTPGGGGGSKRPKARMQQRGPNRLTRDNAGKITSQGGNGATVRGGRLKTASGNLRGRVLAKGPKRSGVIKAQRSATLKATPIKPRVPAADRPGSIINTLGNKAAPAKRGGKTRLPRIATPTGLIRKSDLAKVKTDAKAGIGTPMSRAAQRAIARSAREAPLIRKQAIAAAKRKGRTGFGKGPQMNAGSIGSSAFNWNRSEQPATARERLAMWQKGERRTRGLWSGGRSVAGAAAGELRASRRAARLVDSGSRLGNLPTTRKMAEQPRLRRVDRVSRNETTGRLAASDASRRLLPQIQKVRDAAQKRIAEGKKPTAAQREKERKLVGEYNKAARKLQVAQAAQSYMQNPYGFKPQRMSGGPAKP